MTAVEGERPGADQRQGWTVDDSTFGARLALVRQRMGWNLKEAAVECGIPPASWATWEQGALPRRYADTCEKIAERTGADYVWLMAGPSPEKRRRRSADTLTKPSLTESTSSETLSSSRPPRDARRHNTRPARTTHKPSTTRPAMIPRPVFG